MPLYPYSVSPVSETLKLFITTIRLVRVFTEKEAGRYCMLYLHWNLDEAFIFYYCCLQFFWTHPETMQCFVVDTKSTFFLEAWLVLGVYRNTVVMVSENYWGDFIPKLLLSFLLFCSLTVMYLSPSAACFQLHFIFYSAAWIYFANTINPVAVFVFDKTISSVA